MDRVPEIEEMTNEERKDPPRDSPQNTPPPTPPHSFTGFWLTLSFKINHLGSEFSYFLVLELTPDSSNSPSFQPPEASNSSSFTSICPPLAFAFCLPLPPASGLHWNRPRRHTRARRKDHHDRAH